MKTSPANSCQPIHSLRAIFAALAVLVPFAASAATGTWTNTVSGGLWSAPVNWNLGAIADASGFTADFSTINITTDPTVVHMDASHTLGNLIFGDTTTSSAASWMLDNNANAANILTLAGGTPTITVNALGTGKTATVGPVIAGSTAWTKAGAGILVLTNANTFTGGFTVNAGGTLVATNAGALGVLGSAAVNGTLDLNAGAVTYTGLTNGLSGNGTVNVSVTTGSASSILTTAYGNYANFTGTINIGTNGITGATSVTNPASGKGVIFANMGAATINVLSNASFYVSGSVTNAANTVLYGGTTGEAFGQLRLDGSVLWTGPITLAGNIAGGSSGTIGGNSGTPTITGNITETGDAKQFVKIGGANLVLSGTNKWTGPTIVNGGTLTLLGNQTNYGGFYVGTNNATTSLNIGNTGQTMPTTMNITAGNTVSTAKAAGTTYSTINVYGANGYLTYATNNSSLSIGRNSAFTVGANANWLQTTDMTVMANGGYAGNFNVSAGGTFTYTGTPLITNSTPVSSANANMTVSGTFTTGQGFFFNDLGTGTARPILTLADGGVLNLSANIPQLITGAGGTNVGSFLLGSNAVIYTAGHTTTITNAIANSGSENGSLVVDGGGTVTLSGFNTYTGGTTVTNNTTLKLANGGTAGAIRNTLNIYPGATVYTTSLDSMGYVGGVCVSNINIIGGLLTNSLGNWQGPIANYNLLGGTVGSSGGAFNFYGASQTIASLATNVQSVFNATINLSAGITLNAALGTVPGGVDLNILGKIQGANSITKTGAGVVQLNKANNTYSGYTLINAGTLVLGASATIPNTTNIIVAAGATFDVSAISGFTLGGSQGISGSGTVNGSVTDSGGSQFFPGGIATVGTLTITTNLTLAGGDTLNFDFSAGGSNDVISVGGTLTPNGGTAINLANWPLGGFQNGNYVLIQAASLGGSASSFYLQNLPSGSRQTYNIVYDISSSPQKVLLQVSGGNANLVWQGGGGNPWDVQFTTDWLNSGTNDYFFTSDNVLFSNVPPANAAVSIQSPYVTPGSVTINSTNNYVFTGGYITGTANLVKNGTGSVTLTTANDYTGGTIINSGTLQLGDGVSYNGSVAGAIANNAALVVSNAFSQTLNNNLSGSGQTIASGTSDLTLSGNLGGTQQVVGNDSGGLTLSGANSYTGGTVVSNGVLIAANVTALGVPASGILATVNSGAVLAYHVAGTQTLTNPIVGAGVLAYSNAAPGSLGNGVVGLKLAVSNGFAGGLTVNVGSVYAYNNNALGSGPVTIDNGNLGGGGYYNQLFVGNGLNISNAITVVNAASYYDGVLMVDPGPSNSFGASDTNGGTFSGPITVALGANFQRGALFCGPGNGTNYLIITGPVTNLNANGIDVHNGRVRLSGGGSYPRFSVSAGTAQNGADNGIATNAALLIGGGSFDLNGYNQTFAGLTSSGGGSVKNTSANASTLTLDLSSDNTYGNVISGKVNLVLNGSSILNLTGTNTYTGNTTVNGGTLELAVATLATNSTVTVTNGAVLQLDYSVTNQVAALVLDGTNQAPGVYSVANGNVGSFLAGSGSLLVQPVAAPLSTNAFLLSLALSPVASFSPQFTSNTTNYTASAAYGSVPTITVTNADTSATNKLYTNGVSAGLLASGVASAGIHLKLGVTNLIQVSVTSAAGAPYTNLYTVKLIEQPNPLPPGLSNTFNGSQLSLSWPADHLGWMVQSNSVNLAVPADWQDISNTVSATTYSIPINASQTNVFYRLRLP